MTNFPTESKPENAIGLVENLLQQGHDSRASDIHLIPTRSGMDVLMRCDGTLTERGSIPPVMVPKVIGRLKVLADLMVYRTDVPQEGRIPLARSCIGSEVRVSTYPTLGGEKVAVRLDAQRLEAASLADLGLPEATLQGLAKTIEQPEGLVLVTGPSGSGKTTTLYSCLHHLARVGLRRSIVSVEDPIERRIDGVVQTEINEIVGLGYVEALRSILRQDPDVILVGEIRDQATASIALQAALTGHLVASTIHAGTGPQVFARLMEMGVEPSAVTTVIRGVLAQRLLRRACPLMPAYAGPDACDGECPECHGTGYAGRVLVSEWVPMSDELRDAILSCSDGREWTQAAERAGYRTLRDEAMDLVDAGITTLEEVERVLGSHPTTESRSNELLSDGRPHPVSSDAGGDVPVEGAAAASTTPVIPRPAAERLPEGDDADGSGHRGRDDAGRSVREAGGAAAAPVPVLGESWDR